MQDILAYKQPIASEIDKFFKSQRQLAGEDKWQQDVLKRLDKYTGNGKLMRGALICYTHEAFGGTNAKSALKAAAAIELIQTALLIHDDIMDRDDMRRGQPTIHSQYGSNLPVGQNSTHYGDSMAICAGDISISMAFGILGNIPTDATIKTSIINAYSRALSIVCSGQMLDIDMGYKDKISQTDIMAMMRRKTAGYTTSLPLVTGAILAGQEQQVIDKLYSLGELMGVVFQIRNDELDIFGSPADTGKAVGSDIKEGKKTLYQQRLLSLSSHGERRKLQAIFGNQNATDKDIAYVKDQMLALKVPQTIRQETDKLAGQATKLIDELSLDSQYRQGLSEFLDFCAHREK